jgi:hypothetical protein
LGTTAPIRASQTAEAGSLSRALTRAASTPDTTPAASGNYEIVYPSCNCEVYILGTARIIVRLRWGGATAELAETGADFVTYSLKVDGESFENIQAYRKPAVLVGNPLFSGDPSNAWWVFWDVPLPFDVISSYEDHSIQATFNLTFAVNTGWDIIPAGTKRTFTATTAGWLPLTLTAPTP